MHYQDQGESSLDAAGHILSNKLSGPARGVKDLLTGEDWRGQPFGSTGERLKAAAVDALPSPMPLSGTLQKDPKATLGYKLNDQPGSLEKQALSMAGIKVENAQSPRGQMYRAAEKFRAHPLGQGSAPSVYSPLRQALDNGDLKAAAAEVRQLGQDHGKQPKDIAKALGLRPDGSVAPELFTGSADSERRMLASFTPDQRKLYFQAQKDHATNARRFVQVMGQSRQPAAAAT